MRITSRFFLLLLTLIMFSCGEKNNTADNSNNNNAAPSPGVQNMAAGITLTTFRYLPAEQDLVAEFEKRFRTKVNVNVMSPREIILKAQANQLEGDVFIVPTLEDIVRLKNFNQLQPFYVDVFSEGNVDDGYMDNEGYYAGLTRWTMCAVYDPKAVAVDEVSTYKNLAKLPSRGIKLGIAHPDSSGLAGVVSGLSKIVNPQGAQLWTNIMYNGLAIPADNNDKYLMDQLLLGNLQVAFVSSGAAVRWFMNGDPNHFEAGKRLRVKFPRTETDNVNFFNMTSIGMKANTPNRNMAMRFINFLYLKESQEKLATATFEYPTEAFSETDTYLLGLPDPIGRQVSANTIEDNIPLGWEIINRIGQQQQQ